MKGGYALELRWAKTRTTKDMDMVLLDPKLRSLDRNEQAAAILQKLVLICGVDLDDYFYFEVRLNELITHATFGGARYKVNDRR
ncbi:hypothetical protein BH10CYA1_BH10CYA1_03270 [soil metagenome]